MSKEKNGNHGNLDIRQIGRRSFLCATGAFAASCYLPGCALASGLSASGAFCGGDGGQCSSNNPQPTPSGSITALNLSIANTSSGTIGSAFAGLSYEKSNIPTSLFSSSNTSLIALFKLLGNSILRIGGSSVDTNMWNASGAGQTSGQTAPSDISAFAAFVNATGWKVIYGINLATSTPALAAAEAAYAVSALGSNLLSIEIGNEPDLYASQGYFASTWGVSNYLTLYESFASAILATTPAAPLAGPAISWNTTYFQDLASAKVPGLNRLTAHYYRGPSSSPTPTVQQLVSYPDTSLISFLATLKSAANSARLPYCLGETNSYYSGGASGVSDSYASALWSIDHLFTIAEGGGAGANFHGGGYGGGYTPIANNGATIVGARPLFYGLLFFTLAGQGTLLQTLLSTTSLNVSTYAVQKTGGGISVVINNKDTTNTLSITLTSYQKINNAALTMLSNSSASLSATTGTTIQQATISSSGSFVAYPDFNLTVSGSQVTCYVPPLSAALVKLT